MIKHALEWLAPIARAEKVLLWFFGIMVSVQEMRDRKYKAPPPSLLSLSSHNPTVILGLAKDLYSYQEERFKHTFEKSKNLLTISSLAISLLAPFNGRWSPAWLIAFPSFFIFITILLLLIAFGSNTVMEPIIDEELLKANDAETIIARDYYVSAHYYSYTVSLLVDIYGAARRGFALGLVSLIAITTIAIGRGSLLIDPEAKSKFEAVNVINGHSDNTYCAGRNDSIASVPEQCGFSDKQLNSKRNSRLHGHRQHSWMGARCRCHFQKYLGVCETQRD